MARLLNWPRGNGIVGWQRASGPRSEGETSSESITGKVQTVASAFGAWVYQISTASFFGRRARLHRGLVSALNGGANAVRMPFNDPEVMSFKDAGINVSDVDVRAGVPFSNDMPWSNGCNWRLTRPVVKVIEDAAVGDTVITLADEHWGNELVGGEWIGFMPFHFGKYDITQVLGDRQYRVWPPLRAALTADESYATLNPVMAMRLKGDSAASDSRMWKSSSDNNTLTMVEVPDAVVRSNFAD